MRADFPVVLDANVLAPHGVCDLYLRLAEEPRLFSPRWTKDILEEVRRTQIGKLGFPEELADFWRREVEQAFPEALVEGYEPLIDDCRNDPKDRHVLAAAIKAPAYAIVTFNVKDFPRDALEPYSVVAHHPAEYLCTLYDMAPAIVTRRVCEIAQRKAIAVDEYLRRARRSLARFSEHFARDQGIVL